MHACRYRGPLDATTIELQECHLGGGILQCYSVRSKLEVFLPSELVRVHAREIFHIAQMRIEDLLGEGQRPLEDLLDARQLRYEMRIRWYQAGAVLCRECLP